MSRAIILLLLLALAPNTLAGEPSPVLAADKTVAGVAQVDYTTRWWQWTNKKQWGAKPYQDPSGAQCGLNQSGPVWFLAGTDGTDRFVRHCTMPTGKYLLLPIINMIMGSGPGNKISCEQAKAEAAANNDHLGETRVEIDGVPVSNISDHRLRSDCFNPYPDMDCECHPESYQPAAADGFWLMLKPLPPGQHHIKVYARYNNPDAEYGDLEQDFEYLLDVQEGGPTDPDKPVI